jgi:hypothetical protein
MKLADDLARLEDLKAALRKEAKEAGESFHEEFAGKGRVEVTPPRPAEFKGLMPTVAPQAFVALSDKKRAALLETGVVAMAEQWRRPYYGAVTFKPFKAEARKAA